jgi:hypothetical protein
MAKRWGPVRLANGVTRARSVFKFGKDTHFRPDRFNNRCLTSVLGCRRKA